MGSNPLESVLANFIFHDFKDFSGFFRGFGDLVPGWTSPDPSDLLFCTREMDRSRSSDGVGWSPAACYVGRCIVQVGCATFGGVWRAPKKFNPDDTFFCALFPLFLSQFSGSALKWATLDPREIFSFSLKWATHLCGPFWPEKVQKCSKK